MNHLKLYRAWLYRVVDQLSVKQKELILSYLCPKEPEESLENLETVLPMRFFRTDFRYAYFGSILPDLVPQIRTPLTGVALYQMALSYWLGITGQGLSPALAKDLSQHFFSYAEQLALHQAQLAPMPTPPKALSAWLAPAQLSHASNPARMFAPLVSSASGYAFKDSSFRDYFIMSVLLRLGQQYQRAFEVDVSVSTKRRKQVIAQPHSSRIAGRILAELACYVSIGLMRQPLFLLGLSGVIAQDPAYRGFVLALEHLIKSSATDHRRAQASANAATILARAGIPMSRRNFAGVHIPGADLTQAVLLGTDFTGANLRGVIFNQALLFEANLTGADLTDVCLDRRRSLSLTHAAKVMVTHPSEPWFAVAQNTAVEIRHTQTGALLEKPLGPHPGIVTSLDFTRDAGFVLVGLANGLLVLWKKKTEGGYGSCILGHEPGLISSISFGASGTEFVTAGWSDAVCYWSMHGGEVQLTPLVGHEGVIYTVDFSPKGCLIAAGGHHQHLYIWERDDAQDWSLVYAVQDYQSPISAVTFSPDGKWLAAGDWSGRIQLYPLKDTTIISGVATLAYHSASISSLSFSPDSRYLVSADRVRFAYVWGIGEKIRYLAVMHQHEISSIAFAHDGASILSTDHVAPQLHVYPFVDESVQAWGRLMYGNTSAVNCVDFSHAAGRMASGRDNGILTETAVRFEQGIPIYTPLSIAQEQVTSLGFSPDGRCMVLGHSYGIARTYELVGEKKRLVGVEMGGAKDSINAVSFAPDGASLACAGGDRQVVISTRTADSNSIIVYGAHKATITDLVVSPNGSQMASIDEKESMVFLWKIGSQEKPQWHHDLIGHTAPLRSIAFSSDGKRLVSGGEDKNVLLWVIHEEPGSCFSFPALSGHTGTITSVAFSPDDMTVVSGSEDKTLRLWAIDDEDAMACLQVVHWVAGINAIAFSGRGIEHPQGYFPKPEVCMPASSPDAPKASPNKHQPTRVLRKHKEDSPGKSEHTQVTSYPLMVGDNQACESLWTVIKRAVLPRGVKSSELSATSSPQSSYQLMILSMPLQLSHYKLDWRSMWKTVRHQGATMHDALDALIRQYRTEYQLDPLSTEALRAKFGIEVRELYCGSPRELDGLGESDVPEASDITETTTRPQTPEAVARPVSEEVLRPDLLDMDAFR